MDQSVACQKATVIQKKTLLSCHFKTKCFVLYNQLLLFVGVFLIVSLQSFQLLIDVLFRDALYKLCLTCSNFDNHLSFVAYSICFQNVLYLSAVTPVTEL